jgi:hypothetical protein
MKTKLTIAAIAMFTVMLGISAFAPALADKETAPGQNKVNLCHYDENEDKYVQITVSAKAAESHKKNHPMDKDLDLETGCEVIQPPTDTDGDGVSDELDLCPDTPLDVTVDETGCEVIETTPEG